METAPQDVSGVGVEPDNNCRFAWHQSTDRRVVEITGEIDLSNSHRIRDSLVQLDNRSLLIDLTGVTFMDSTGIRALAEVQAHLNGRELILRIEDGGRVDRLLDLTGLKTHFKTENPL
ncbi:STAS domain-containing protein [soil metagenome]